MGPTAPVTSVPVLINRVLVPALSTLLARYPDLRIELIADARDLNARMGRIRPTASGSCPRRAVGRHTPLNC